MRLNHKLRNQRMLMALAIYSCLSGCAINASGLVRVDRFENETAIVLGLRAHGLHLFTHRYDAGFVFGRSERIYIFPRPSPSGNRSTDFPLKKYFQHASSPLARVHENASAIPDTRPIAVFTSTTGLLMEGNDERIGFTLGKLTRSSLRLSQELSALLFLKLNSIDIDETEVFFQENKP